MLRAWVLLIVGVAGLMSMRAAYNLTYEPAPVVRVRWRDGTGEWRRTWLEHKYRLEDPANPEGLSYSYILLDTSRRNIQALVKDPEAADTHDIDRRKFEVPFWTAEYGGKLMWVADRIPLMRQPLVRYLMVGALAGCTLIGGCRIIGEVIRHARQ
jgi:hypothetical protein